MAFRGTFDYTLDVKNRLTIPARFRATFSDGLVLALRHDTQSCISVWRPDQFDAYVAAILASFHPLSDEYATVNRFYNSNSHEIELDSAPGQLELNSGSGYSHDQHDYFATLNQQWAAAYSQMLSRLVYEIADQFEVLRQLVDWRGLWLRGCF